MWTYRSFTSLRLIFHPVIRKLAITIWILFILTGLAFYFLRPDIFTPNGLAALVLEFRGPILVAYLVLSVFRGFTLLPSTPLVLAGTLLFPSDLFIVLAVSLIGIGASSSMIYWLSEHLGFAEFFEARKAKAVDKIRHRLESRGGLLFVLLWSFVPLVPTDAVCYVAGTVRMNYPKFIAAVLAGETILCSIYIFAAGWFLSV